MARAQAGKINSKVRVLRKIFEALFVSLAVRLVKKKLQYLAFERSAKMFLACAHTFICAYSFLRLL